MYETSNSWISAVKLRQRVHKTVRASQDTISSQAEVSAAALAAGWALEISLPFLAPLWMWRDALRVTRLRVRTTTDDVHRRFVSTNIRRHADPHRQTLVIINLLFHTDTQAHIPIHTHTYTRTHTHTHTHNE